MNIKCWSHRNGFRSPTEKQLAGWETDGGNHQECDDAVLFEGRLYSCPAALLKARVERGLKKLLAVFHHKIDGPAILTRLSATLPN